MNNRLHRRELLAAGGAALTAFSTAALSAEERDATTGAAERKVRYCLNTSTLRDHKLTLVEEIDIAAEAGYDGIEPWIGEITRHAESGGNLDDLKKRIADRGLTVESAIGFARWIVDDEAERAKGMEDARRDMELVQRIGGSRIAAPPAGATGEPRLDLLQAAARYGALLDAGREIGVTPQLEVWGFSKNLSRLGETACVAIESGRPDACILPDVYHLYKGGSDFEGLALLNAAAIHVFHLNDYPASPARSEISDAHRVYPGDGVAPLSRILAILFAGGFQGALSLELFNKEYGQQDPRMVAKTGLAKMRKAVAVA